MIAPDSVSSQTGTCPGVTCQGGESLRHQRPTASRPGNPGVEGAGVWGCTVFPPRPRDVCMDQRDPVTGLLRAACHCHTFSTDNYELSTVPTGQRTTVPERPPPLVS